MITYYVGLIGFRSFWKNPNSAKNLKTGFWAFLTLAGIPSAAHDKIKMKILSLFNLNN